MESPSVKIDETAWRVTSFEGGAIGSGPEFVDQVPEVRPPGLLFSSDKGQTRFLELDFPELPTNAQLRELPLDRLIEYFRQAKAVR